MDSFVQLSCLLPELWSLKCQKWLIFCIFCRRLEKISHSLDKIRVSERSLQLFQKMLQSFVILLLTQQFFHISTLDISRTVTPKPYYFLAFKIHIYMVNMALSSMLTQLSFVYLLTSGHCVPNLISIFALIPGTTGLVICHEKVGAICQSDVIDQFCCLLDILHVPD